MIELKNIHKSYTRKNKTVEALKGINLKIDKGDIFGVIGYSGAGKSTLIRLVNYLEIPTKGEVIVNGQSLATFNKRDLRETKKQIGMIFQHFNLLESKKIFDNVAIPLVLQRKSKLEIKKRVIELLEFVGLSDKSNSYPNELSGGQKQRVGIARALASNPSILLCDEATSALDPETTQSILELLRKINAEYNITIMIITHEMTVIQEICNKVAVMENGKIIESGTVLEVFGKPQHQTTKNFVQTVIHAKVPNSLLNTVDYRHQIFKLEFIGETASEPIIYELIHHYKLKLNILYANMTEIQGTAIGNMIIQLYGESLNIQNALTYLQDKHVFFEEVHE